MAVPTSYTESGLLNYMLDALGKTATDLSWDTSHLAEALNDALILAGLADAASATDIPKLRASARLAAWRAVEAETSGNYRFSTDGQAFSREQIHEHAVAMVKRARVEAMRHGIDHTVGTLRIRRTDDPYTYYSDDERSTA